MISKSEFLNRIHGGIFPLLKKVDQERSAMIRKWGIGMVILAVILTVVVSHLIGFDKMKQKDSYWGYIPVITFIVPLLIGASKIDVFSYQLKQKFIPILYDIVELKKKHPIKKTILKKKRKRK